MKPGVARPRPIEDIYPLSPMQEGMLFHVLEAPEDGLYVVQLGYRLQGALDERAFERAWQQVVDRHQALRTSVRWTDLERPLQVVQRAVAAPVEWREWSAWSEPRWRAELDAQLAAERARGFDLARPPLVRLMAARLDGRDWILTLSFHHIVLDGWSLGIVLRELLAAYDAYRRGREPELDPPRPYGDYILWLQRQDMDQARTYWRRALSGFASPTPLPGASPASTDAEASFGDRVLSFTVAETDALRAFAATHHVTLGTLAHGAWALLLSRYAGVEEVLFGTVTAGRPAGLPGVESTVGLFINTLPLRVRAAPGLEVGPFLVGIQHRLLELRQYEFAPLAEIQGWSDVGRRLPLFESLIAIENYPPVEGLARPFDAAVLTELESRERVSYPLGLEVAPGRTLALKLNYVRNRFEDRVAERLLRHLRSLLNGLAEDAGRRLREVQMLAPEERGRVVSTWNATEAEYPHRSTVHELFEARARETPDAVALVTGEARLTYAGLNRAANRLAHHLLHLGVGAEDRVGVCMDRSVELVAAILGILKAGAAYVPLDPEYPPARLAYMLEDSRASALVTREALAEALSGLPPRIVCIDRDRMVIEACPDSDPRRPVDAENLAYVIYTSGSTGQPKGVLVAHRGLANVVSAQRRMFGLGPADRVLQFSSISFDASAFELLMAFGAGASLHLAPQDQLLPGPGLAELLTERRISVVTLPPSVLAEVPPAAFPDLALVTVAGEACPGRLVSDWAPGRRFLNLYGPTETTIWATAACCEGAAAPPIGQPIQNVRAYVLDPELEPLPVGVAGELCIGGESLARGYLGRPGQTAERFVPDPHAGRGGRIYRTGDRARWREDGSLEFLGRSDDQVKIRGFRIELAEVETVLAEHPAVRECAVVAHGEPGGRRLVAYLVARSGRPTVGELRRHLRRRLPEHMVPAAFVTLERMPLTPNGKLDRNGLPLPWHRPQLEVEYVAPRTPVEASLADIWRDLLGVDRVGVHDTFFDLGGHSLLTIQAVARAGQVGLKFSTRQLVRNPTIAELGALLGAAHSSAAAAAAVEAADASPLVPIQARGDLPPVFAVHPIGGQVYCYFPLAEALGEGQPLHGLQGPDLADDMGDVEIEAVAAAYAKAIRRFQPAGPYLLLGWSYGGLLAYEMSCLLHRQGHDVPLLVLVDSGGPDLLKLGPESDPTGVLSLFSGDAARDIRERVAADPTWASLTRPDRLDRVRRLLVEGGVLAEDVDPGWLDRLERGFQRRLEAARRYDPGRFSGRVVLVRARVSDPADLALLSPEGRRLLAEPGFGWDRYLARPPEVHWFDCRHDAVLMQPTAAGVARILRAEIDAGLPPAGHRARAGHTRIRA